MSLLRWPPDYLPSITVTPQEVTLQHSVNKYNLVSFMQPQQQKLSKLQQIHCKSHNTVDCIKITQNDWTQREVYNDSTAIVPSSRGAALGEQILMAAPVRACFVCAISSSKSIPQIGIVWALLERTGRPSTENPHNSVKFCCITDGSVILWDKTGPSAEDGNFI